MKVIVDEDIPYAYELFIQFADVELLSGRRIVSKSLKQADALIVRSITRVNDELLDGTKIKFVGTATSGVDHVDQGYLSNSSIFFSSASGCNAVAVAEYVLSLLLWLAKRDKFFLCDKVVGIIGFGNIGSYVYEKLSLLGVTTLLCDPILEKKNCRIYFSSLEKLVKEADILTFHVPLNFDHPHSTWHMVGDDFLDALSENCILINTSRGSVFDNMALLRILECGKKLRVILDVWENEPKILFPLLKYLEIGTPHVAGCTYEGKVRSIVRIFNDFKKFFGISAGLKNFVLPVVGPSHYFEVCHDVNEDILFCLSNFVYNIFGDDMRLRCGIRKPYFFDLLRKSHLYRREWSSISIRSSNIVYARKFKNFGFSTCDFNF